MSLTIGIASSPDERQRLVQLLGGTDAVLIVSTVEQARQFLDATRPAATVTADDAAPTPPPSNLSVDSGRRVLCWRDREVELTRLEHDLLRCLIGEPGQVWTHERLHLTVWGNAHLGRGSDLHSVVRRVRRKLVRLGASATIDAVRGVGFRLALT
ncbi:winged helix-turn-helix domain-containing protein [Micromonospora sp. NPDC050686]|uniref:winged helix-turn-helix domain-containing protein n=1 Tax=Micromonospora sp. NPDC050686 TaxID=3154631 RepID=UPI0033C1EF4A